MSPAVPIDGFYRIKVATISKYMEYAPAKNPPYVRILDFNPANANQEWKIMRAGDRFKIETAQGDPVGWQTGTRTYWSRGYLCPVKSSEFTWEFQRQSTGFYKITSTNPPTGGRGSFLDVCDDDSVHFWPANTTGVHQNWVFEFVRPLPTPSPPQVISPQPEAAMAQNGFQDKFFPLTPAEAAKQEYDLIIVGSGIGGGILANDLYDTNFKVAANPKRVLLLEKGGLVFHSHCLNTARPSGLIKDRGQQNDTFFSQFKDNFLFNPPRDSEWKGGPMYNLGGRSAAWGLFAPRVHDEVLKKTFTPDVVKELQEEYYDKAELLMKLSLPSTKRVHQHVIDLLNMGSHSLEKITGVQWQWGRLASEFREERNFDFAEGAYSTIDKILEIAMSRKVQGDHVVEHKNFKTVLNADVRSLSFDANKTVTAVNVRGPGGEQTVPIKLAKDGQVVLSAGSVDSPGILLRSSTSTVDFKKLLPEYNGLHLTDHDILAYTCSFRYKDPRDRETIGAMKLQTYARFGGEVVLVNMSIDASSFLPRSHSSDDSLPKMIIVFMRQSPLVQTSNISLDPTTNEPRVEMSRRSNIDDTLYELFQKMTVASMKAIQNAAKVKFVGIDESLPADKIQFDRLQWGAVAHELGTLPTMVGRNPSAHTYCLDRDLRIRPEICNNVYVCDLSVFPYSPEANPTLTLAALAIRLSRHLHPRKITEKIPSNQVRVINHTGSKVKVWLSNYKTHDQDPCYKPGVSGPCQPLAWANETVQRESWWHLGAGEQRYWDRVPGVPQTLMVFKLDHIKQNPDTFLTEPVFVAAHAGEVTPILDI